MPRPRRYVRLYSLGQHFVGPSGNCGTATNRVKSPFDAPAMDSASPSNTTHSMMMEPSSVGSGSLVRHPSSPRPNVASSWPAPAAMLRVLGAHWNQHRSRQHDGSRAAVDHLLCPSLLAHGLLLVCRSAGGMAGPPARDMESTVHLDNRQRRERTIRPDRTISVALRAHANQRQRPGADAGPLLIHLPSTRRREQSPAAHWAQQ